MRLLVGRGSTPKGYIGSLVGGFEAEMNLRLFIYVPEIDGIVMLS